MQVSVLLQSKGPEVVTVRPGRPITEVLEVLVEHRIGAVVVTGDDRTIDGIVSERDIVRAIASLGAGALSATASEVMATEVATCEPDTTVERLMEVMTEQRSRHMPVLVEGELVGLVSIGDVVKHRVASLEHEAQALQDYITNPY
ncbi:MAG: CBS domain-containing protein [Acidimicrobiales bacterium]|nr:CBS domain-containing protein [Acidimicrobiales bacterium]